MRPPSEVEVLVVGAGPGGSMSALRLAEAGREVLLVEKRPEIGNPVRCAEALDAEVLHRVISELDPSWIASPVYGARGLAPDGREVRYIADEPVGMVLNRRLFDRGLAARAAAAGATVRTRVRAFSPRREGDGWRVRLRYDGGSVELRCRLLLAADGVEGGLSRALGLVKPWPKAELHSCAQARVVGLEPEDKPLIDFHLGSEVAPGGYGWRFPTGGDRANVGLCVHPPEVGRGAARELLARMLERRFPEARAVELAAGSIPALKRPRRIVDDGLLIVGDAAGHSEPLSGGGIANALQGAELAARIAAEAFESGDLSRHGLEAYEREWSAGVGRSLRRYAKLRRFYLSLGDRDFNDALRLLDEQLERWRAGKKGTVLSLLTAVMRGSPRLLLKARHLL